MTRTVTLFSGTRKNIKKIRPAAKKPSRRAGWSEDGSENIGDNTCVARRRPSWDIREDVRAGEEEKKDHYLPHRRTATNV